MPRDTPAEPREMNKAHVFRCPATGRWWLSVPRTYLEGRERGDYYRQSFVEIMKLIEFFAGRYRARIAYER